MLIDISVSEAIPSLLSKTFGIKAWVLRRTDGSDPAISDVDIAADIAYANEFWSRYGFGIELSGRIVGIVDDHVRIAEIDRTDHVVE